MKKITKVFLVIGVAAVVVGAVMVGIGLAANGGNGFSVYWDRGFKLAEDELLTMDKTEFEAFKDIDINVTGKVNLVENSADKYEIEYSLYSSEDLITCEVKNNKLVVKTDDEVNFFNFGGFNFDDDNVPYITVYYPAGSKFDSIKVDTSAGGFFSENELKAESLFVDVSAGGVELENYEGAFEADCSAGGIVIKNSYLTDMNVDLSAGGIEMRDSKVNGGKLEVSAGGVEGYGIELLNDMDIDCSAGSIEIELTNGGDDIGYDIDSSAGSIIIDGDKFKDEVNLNTDADIMVNIDCSAGSVEITHKK